LSLSDNGHSGRDSSTDLENEIAFMSDKQGKQEDFGLPVGIELMNKTQNKLGSIMHRLAFCLFNNFFW